MPFTYRVQYVIRIEAGMNRKLTLSLDATVIGKAKQYASEQNESLSGIVERYLRAITNPEERGTIEITPTVKELLGSVTVPDDFDYGTEKHEYLKEKRLRD